MTKQQKKILYRILLGAVLFLAAEIVIHFIALRGGESC